jgi:hypothetical protein
MKPGTFVQSILEKIIDFFQESKNQERVKKYCMDPLFSCILDTSFPYLIAFLVLLGIFSIISIINTILLVMLIQKVSALETTKI